MARAPMMATPPVLPLRCISAPDTVTVFMSEYKAGLEQALEGRPRPVGNGYWVNWPQRNKSPLLFQWPYRICLQPASSRDLKTIRNHALDLRIVRADIALDLIVSSRYEAELLEVYVLDHLVKRYGRRQERWTSLQDQAVTYSDWRSKTDRRYAVYSDKLSKRTGEPCVHVELRFNGVRFAQRGGLGTISQILNLAHDDFWNEHLSLRSVAPNQVATQVKKFAKPGPKISKKTHARRMAAWRNLGRRTRSPNPYRYAERRRAVLHVRGKLCPNRYHGRKLEYLPVADLLYSFPNLKRLAAKVDHTWALPPREGGCTW